MHISFVLLQHTCYYIVTQIEGISTIARPVNLLRVDVDKQQLEVVRLSICEQLFLCQLSNSRPTRSHYLSISPNKAGLVLSSLLSVHEFVVVVQRPAQVSYLVPLVFVTSTPFISSV